MRSAKPTHLQDLDSTVPLLFLDRAASRVRVSKTSYGLKVVLSLGTHHFVLPSTWESERLALRARDKAIFALAHELHSAAIALAALQHPDNTAVLDHGDERDGD